MKDLNDDSRSEGQDLNPELPKKNPFLYRKLLKNSRYLCRPHPQNYLNLRTALAQLATTFIAVICLQSGQT